MARRQGAEISERDRLQIALRYQQIKDGSSNESVQHLCTAFGISRNVPAGLYRQIRERGSLQTKPRSGRPSLIKNYEMQQRLITAIRGRRTISSRQLGLQLGCSNKTANTMRHVMKFKTQDRIRRPPLSAQNIQRRLEWCREHPTVAPHTAFLDEKWWRTFRGKKKVYRRSTSPPIYDHPPAHAPKAMFIAVVSRDAPQGKVGLWPVAEQRQYQRNSRYHRRGDTFWHDLSCDGPYFCHLLDTEILPACERSGIRILQMDNATPHITDNVHASITEVMAHHPTVRLLMQPPQSPDVSPLDQGIFSVLADAVELRNPTTRQELHEAVLQSWASISERKILTHIRQQALVRAKIVECRGGNRFV